MNATWTEDLTQVEAGTWPSAIKAPVPPVNRKANRVTRRHLARQGVVAAACFCGTPVALAELWYSDDRPCHEACATDRAAAIGQVADEMAAQAAAADDRDRLARAGLHSPNGAGALVVARARLT